MEVCGQVHDPGRFTPQGKSPWYPFDRRLVGSQSRSGRRGKDKNSRHLPGLEVITVSILRATGHQNVTATLSHLYSTGLIIMDKLQGENKYFIAVHILKKFHTFFRYPEGSQKSVTRPYPEPTLSFIPSYSNLRLLLMLSSHLNLTVVKIKTPFLDISRPKFCIHFSFISCRLCTTYSILDRLEAFTVVKIHAEVFWVETPCSVVVGYQRFGGSCCFHLHLDSSRFITLTILDEEFKL
jgi:hypothetical protein